jgi:hypothetical protein
MEPGKLFIRKGKVLRKCTVKPDSDSASVTYVPCNDVSCCAPSLEKRGGQGVSLSKQLHRQLLPVLPGELVRAPER